MLFLTHLTLKTFQKNLRIYTKLLVKNEFTYINSKFFRVIKISNSNIFLFFNYN